VIPMRNFILTMLASLGLFVGAASFNVGCTKAQTVAAVNAGVQISVDLCQVAPDLAPVLAPGAAPVVALLCPAVEAGAKPVLVFIDQLIWNAMVAQKAAQRTHSTQTNAITR
jgi:hypothetical protein